ncbi:MAG: glycosyltransferase [Pseudomonadota bacterium]
MIFLTVGTQLPFDRLVSTVDDWSSINPTANVFGQIGPSSYLPHSVDFKKFLVPSEFNSIIKKTDLIVSHAGVGTVLTALQNKIPIIIMPRKYEFKEHRNNHQMATVKRFANIAGVYVADDEKELTQLLHQIGVLKTPSGINDYADDNMIESLRTAIHL